MTRRWRAIGCVVAVFCACSAVRRAAANSEPVEIQVYAIRATTANQEVSPELKNLATMLSKQFKYTGFRLEKKSAGRVEMEKTFETELIEGYSAQVTPREFKNGRVKMSLQVSRREGEKSKQKVKTDLTTERGKFVLVGVEKLGENEFLIIAAAAR